MTGMPTQPTVSWCRSPLHHLLVHFSPYAGTIGSTFLYSSHVWIMAKHGTVVWEPITFVVDYFEGCVVDGVNTLVFEHRWNKGCVVMAK